jgi:hypothetical protein
MTEIASNLERTIVLFLEKSLLKQEKDVFLHSPRMPKGCLSLYRLMKFENVSENI